MRINGVNGREGVCMNRKMICGIVLALFAVFSACAQYDRESDFRFELLDGGRAAVITGYVGTRQTVRIPPRIQGSLVTAIGFRAFSEKEIISVTIPNSVTNIGVGAFEGNQLTSVVIPDSVIEIGADAFCETQLTSVNIGNSVTVIGSSAFSDNLLTSVVIPDSVTVILDGAFNDNPITHIIIGANVNIFAPSTQNRFHEFYHAQGRRAGTYTWNDGWSVEFR